MTLIVFILMIARIHQIQLIILHNTASRIASLIVIERIRDQSHTLILPMDQIGR